MASSSNAIPFTDDVEDDEFDWEAAVREIDIACAQPTTEVNRQGEGPSKNISNVCSSTSSRQSTLERFLGISSKSKDAIRENTTGKQKLEDFGNGVIRNCNKGEEQEGGADAIHSFVNIDVESAKTWIYPVSEKTPLRDYQFNITQTALFCNTLVALPTGLGKTFIAAVVMYNYFRWFPEGKIVFAAPSRPLVMQQIEACHKIVGIPQEWTVDLTGQTSPIRRACHWKSKRVFFVTPQVLEKDIQSGACLMNHLVCLVIDEAHRATGNYSYCVVLRELMSVPVPVRILALTATPGSKQQTIQHIIDNLQISTLEYRNETDPDVKPYVHDRKIELMKVPLGKDAAEIDKLMLDVIRPYVNRLCQLGVLPNRDFQTLSPCDILNSRDKFRQQPPADLPQSRYGELEGCFGALVTLYHIRKLLSSHGIRPAFEMVDEKLRQGSFARLMSRNEDLLKAKLLMQQNMSHGAPSPKLSKMLEVLIDHFKTKNKLNSRVIIFSNFRGSVRDIMNALRNIQEYVKPTEFIGQSSGKSLKGQAQKGQSQKVQQAVLEKFRAGGYNVIVATSIGEEGLDIMEVDLVICFDANISPFRMIQRMGRTGRKHEGRVVVLACEGSELRGYLRKQSTGKVMKKHMRNGGTTSFCFHSSPRMIPHIFKPEVQVVELSIQQFVPRSKKVCEDQLTDSPAYIAKLTDSENSLIAKYFNSTQKDSWRPSLIAFPHFQAELKDIMNALRNIQEYVKPTEFIGQSSGKSLKGQAQKGQSQKVQQAVLEKFRAGGYNVIVATSIGEEGLDIMEVDLVICFDANISPLRMIQRMGRTGRKHEGRVVLACEGSELRGYLRKQSTGKVMKKHMRNGGTTSFCFHSSPRMIPHIFKPEVQVVELSIQQFVPRSKKVCEDQLTDSPAYIAKLTDSENSLIAKYFNSTQKDSWRPSLIAFPHFQAFPSRVHRVVHSLRSTMLIEAMQHLQEISCSRDDNAFDTAGRPVAEQHSLDAVKEYNEHSEGDLHAESLVSSMKICNSFSEEDCKGESSNAIEKPMGDVGSDQVQSSPTKSLTHSFLFDSGFVSVNYLGEVEISSVPVLPVMKFSQDKCASSGRIVDNICLKRDPVQLQDLAQKNGVFLAQMESYGNGVSKSKISNSVSMPVEELITIDEAASPMQISKQKLDNDCTDIDSPKLTHNSCIDAKDVEFSPRLSNYIESGVVPESPISYAGMPAHGSFMVPDHLSTPELHTELPEKCLQQNRASNNDMEACMKNISSLSKTVIQTHGAQENGGSQSYKSRIILDTSVPEDSQLNAGGMSESVEPKYKLKRLRKHGDLLRKRPPDCENKNIARSLNFRSSSSDRRHVQIQDRRVKKLCINDARVFIEEEAEVSSDVTVSEDEEDQRETNSCDSFIDDKSYPTAQDTQAEGGRIDMMAVYRRSLLSQSPIPMMVDTSADVTPSSVSRTDENASTSGRESLQTPENILKSTARDYDSVYLINRSRVASHSMQSRTSDFPPELDSKTENRKRNASLYEAGHMPVQNLYNEFSFHSKIPKVSSVLHVQVDRPTETAYTSAEPNDLENGHGGFDDDSFFDNIDFDAVEEQAAKLLGCKSQCPALKQTTSCEPEASNIAVSSSPSFDLGF